MLRQRLLMIGIILLALGVQLRRVEHFVVNKQVTRIVENRLKRPAADAVNSFDAGSDPFKNTWQTSISAAPASSQMSVSPPRWLGFSMVSVGAVMVLTCPCFKS